MAVVSCPAPGCQYQTVDEDPTVVAALLNIHAVAHTTATTTATVLT